MTLQDILADPFRLIFYVGLGLMLGCTFVSAAWELPWALEKTMSRARGRTAYIAAIVLRLCEFAGLMGCIIYVARADSDFGVVQTVTIIVASLLVSPLKRIQQR